MRKELDDLLCKKYPKIFKDRHGDKMETLMCWGFDIGDGWFHIIDTLCGQIQGHIDHHIDSMNRDMKHNALLKKYLEGYPGPLREHYYGMFNSKEYADDCLQRSVDRGYREIKEVYQVVAVQVKEKFGGLRFYYNGGSEYVDGLVAMAEAISYVTCERCGKVGKPNNSGWIVTLCDDCRGYKLEDHEEDVEDEIN